MEIYPAKRVLRCANSLSKVIPRALTRQTLIKQSMIEQPVLELVLIDVALQVQKFLLHGVTGSGKTEIYLHAIAETIKQGKQAVVLVPEIALTPQTVARFAARFPNRVTVIHSGLSPGERYDVWRHLRDGQFDIVIGPRSALFAPLSRLGLIVIDEEHESSYKQNAEEWGSFTIFYDRSYCRSTDGGLAGVPLIMGSATPSLESYYAAEQGQITLMEMSSRVLGHQHDSRFAGGRPQGQPVRPDRQDHGQT